MNRRSLIKSLALVPLAMVLPACKPRSCPTCPPPIPENNNGDVYAHMMKEFRRYMNEVEIPHLKRMTKHWDKYYHKFNLRG